MDLYYNESPGECIYNVLWRGVLNNQDPFLGRRGLLTRSIAN